MLSNQVQPSTEPITRDQFMEFFRDDELLNTLSIDDRIEVFSTIMAGSSDFKADLLRSVLADYNVGNIYEFVIIK